MVYLINIYLYEVTWHMTNSYNTMSGGRWTGSSHWKGCLTPLLGDAHDNHLEPCCYKVSHVGHNHPFIKVGRLTRTKSEPVVCFINIISPHVLIQISVLFEFCYQLFPNPRPPFLTGCIPQLCSDTSITTVTITMDVVHLRYI